MKINLSPGEWVNHYAMQRIALIEQKIQDNITKINVINKSIDELLEKITAASKASFEVAHAVHLAYVKDNFPNAIIDIDVDIDDDEIFCNARINEYHECAYLQLELTNNITGDHPMMKQLTNLYESSQVLIDENYDLKQEKYRIQSRVATVTNELTNWLFVKSKKLDKSSISTSKKAVKKFINRLLDE